jgi:hypothetical protein
MSYKPKSYKLLDDASIKPEYQKLIIDILSSSTNPNILSMLEKNPDRIHWSRLSSNPNAIHLLERNLDKVDWKGLSKNPNAIHLLEQNPDKIVWFELCENPNAIPIIEKNLDKLLQVDWHSLSTNPNAIHILEKNPDKIIWREVYKNPNAIQLLQIFDWNDLPLDNGIIDIFRTNIDIIDNVLLSMKSGILTYEDTDDNNNDGVNEDDENDDYDVESGKLNDELDKKWMQLDMKEYNENKEMYDNFSKKSSILMRLSTLQNQISEIMDELKGIK